MLPSKNLGWSSEVNLYFPNLCKSFISFHTFVSMHEITTHKAEVYLLACKNQLLGPFLLGAHLWWCKRVNESYGEWNDVFSLGILCSNAYGD
jgi:hypothetical protein